MREVGYSLLESMVVLAIISVLAIAATANVFSNQESQRVEQGLRSLYSLSQAARQLAITEAREVVVEQSPHGWRIREGAIAHQVQAEFRGFRGSRVRFYPNGSSDNGSWTLCIRFEFWASTSEGNATDTRMAMIAITIMLSSSVKPCWRSGMTDLTKV